MQQHVERERVEGAVDRLQVPGARRDGRGLRALRRPGAATADGGDAGGERLERTGSGRGGGRGRRSHRPSGSCPRRRSRRSTGPITSAGCTPSAMSGLPERPSATIRPSRMPTSARTTPQWSSTIALVMTVSSAPSARVRRRLGHRLADRLAAAEDGLLAAEGQVLLDLDPQVGVAEAHLVARGRAVERGVLRATDLNHQCRSALIWMPGHDARDPRSATISTSREAPGSKRREVPDGMSSRKPSAASRSNVSAALTSARWMCDPIWTGPVAGVDDHEGAPLVGAAVGVEHRPSRAPRGSRRVRWSDWTMVCSL